MTRTTRIAVTGAAGRISYALLFRIAAGGMFGPGTPVSLSLLEAPGSLPLLDATVMELEDCPFPLLKSVHVSTDPAEAFDGADWILMIGSSPYQPGMSRSEVMLANAPMFQAQGRAINESARTARVLVVANPCNTNCQVARAAAHDVPPNHWFAMTRLDQNRARCLIARKADVPVDQVTRVTVWGNHSPAVYADFHNAWIGKRPAHEVIDDPAWVRDVFEPGVSGRGRALHEARGGSPAGSAAQAIIGTVRSLCGPTPLDDWLCAGVVSDGSYGVTDGLVFGFPLRTAGDGTWSIVQNHYLDEHAQERIRENVAELEHEAAVVSDFLQNRLR